MAKNLTNDGFKADALNGNLNQNKRDKVMNNFRLKKFKVLVATDIASRGLDVDHIEHVVNYDLPWNPTRVLQRVGRVNRVGTKHENIFGTKHSKRNPTGCLAKNHKLNPVAIIKSLG